MKLERIQTIQRLPIQIEEAWDFFTSPRNQRLITPHWLDYRLTIEPPEYLHPGTIVSALIRPVPMVSTQWVSEITHIRPPHFFISEQRFGPFKMWHHEHHFRAHEDGVEIEDIIMYGMHFGLLGTLAHDLFVRKKLHEVLSHRAQTLEKRFGSMRRPVPPAQQPQIQVPPGLQQQRQKPKPRQQQRPKPQHPGQGQPKRPQAQQPGQGQQKRPQQGAQPNPTPQKQVTLDDIFGKTED